MVPSVLIVDDEKNTREGLQQALGDDYDVSVAGNADEAFNLMESSEFDVVLTDLRMPRLDGSGLIRAVRALAPGLPVVVMSGFAPATDAEDFRRPGEGPVAVFAKPLDMDALLAEITRLLQR